jgi:glycosyltransferase involved in cell wall biosynthesis
MSLNPKSRIVFIDLTATLESGLNSGIQRVSKEFAKNLSRLRNSESDSYFIPIYCKTLFSGKIQVFPVERNWLEKIQNSNSNTSFILNLRKKLRQTRLLRHIFIVLAQRGFIYNLYSSSILWKMRRSGIVKNLPIKIPKNASLLLVDQYWNSRASLKLLHDFKSESRFIYIFLHDMLPMSHPQYFEKNQILHFRKIVPDTLKIATKIFVSSIYVAGEIRRFIYPNPQINKVSLGSNIMTCKNQNLNAAYLTDAPYFLQVGNLEPRKNHKEVLQWYLSSERTEHLVIVGNIGWNAQNIVLQLRESIRMSKGKIHWLRNQDDEELNDLMARASVGICASFAEGYDLPMREFLYHGKPVVASNIESHNEESLKPIKDFIHYFQHGDISSLSSAIELACANKKVATIESPLKTWEEAAEELANLLLGHVS